ncbi:virulence factor Pgp3 [bacterium]|nr:virulence factor Pgp3 [bacterium]
MTTTITGATGIDNIQAATGAVLQVVNFQTGTLAVGTGVITYDNTIPQITEGTEFMTATITPKSTTSTLIIDARFVASPSTSAIVVGSLFQDSVGNALATTFQYFQSGGHLTPQTILHKMVSGTTSATTFRLRAGCHVSATTTFNGRSGSAFFGGTLASSITITEIAG